MKKQSVAKKVVCLILGLVMMFGFAVPVAGFDADGVWDRLIDDEFPTNHARITVTSPTFEVTVDESRWYILNVPVGAALTVECLGIGHMTRVSFIAIYIPIRIERAPNGGTGTAGGWNPRQAYERIHTQALDWRNPITTYIFEEAGEFYFVFGGEVDFGESISTRGLGAFYVNVSGDAPAFTPTPALDEVTVTVGGVPVNFDQPPVIVEERTLVPVRGVFEMLGFDVDWDRATSTAIISNASYEIRITIGSAAFTVNGAAYQLDVPAQSIGGRTLVPIRLPLERVGFNVEWDRNTKTVIITAQ